MSNKTLGVIALVLAFVFPLAGLIVGIVALAQPGKSNGEGKGLAIAAIIISSVAMVFVLLAVIGAMAYFGALSPSTLLPEKCTFPVSLSCVDHAVYDKQITLTFQNGAGRNMTVTGISASSEALGTGNLGQGCSTGAITTTVRDGETTTFTLSTGDVAGACNFRDTGRDKNRYNVTVTYNWLDDPAITHRLAGELLERVP